jgi:hypothetical protein
MIENPSAQEQYEQGMRAEADGEYREAALLYRAALEQEPHNPEFQAASERADSMVARFPRRQIKKAPRGRRAILSWHIPYG